MCYMINIPMPCRISKQQPFTKKHSKLWHKMTSTKLGESSDKLIRPTHRLDMTETPSGISKTVCCLSTDCLASVM